MISQALIGSLTDNQVHFLIYIINKGFDKEVFGYSSLKSLRLDAIRKTLVKNKPNIKDEYQQEYSDLCRIFGA